nr:MAG TPA: hypothetical protein [Caudoviricetes sp.]
MMRKDIKHIKGIGFDDVTDDIVKDIMVSEKVSYAHAVRILIRIAHDKLKIYPRIVEGYTDVIYSQREMGEE